MTRQSIAYGGFVKPRQTAASLWITHVRRVKIGVVLWPEAGCAFGATAMGKGSSMEIIDFFPRACAQCDHGTVTRGSGALVERFAHPECELVGAAFNVRSRIRTPTGCRSIPLWITGINSAANQARPR